MAVKNRLATETTDNTDDDYNDNDNDGVWEMHGMGAGACGRCGGQPAGSEGQQEEGQTYRQMYRQTEGQNYSPLYRTLSPVGATAKEGKERKKEGKK